ncbi:hypothetical protein KC19_2G220100 [Ceratodon purpureus]|uniref:Uncharacterized protein n=1 Tax=Ceratodon purpureus TaxID=3225 RepID=A0A8T0IZ26_CERPU|nr:hypothetical protein KC19_2G220100 [Ceratodon purpureus]
MRGRLSHTQTAESSSTLFFVFLHSRDSHHLFNAPSLPWPAPAHDPYSQVPLMPTLSATVGSILDSVVHCGCACMHVIAVLIDALAFVSGVCDLLLVVAFESRGRKLPRARGV